MTEENLKLPFFTILMLIYIKLNFNSLRAVGITKKWIFDYTGWQACPVVFTESEYTKEGDNLQNMNTPPDLLLDLTLP